MSTFELLSSKLEDRFDPRYYNPKYTTVLKKLQEKAETEGFTLKKLGDIVTPKTSAFYSSIAKTYGNEGIPFIRVKDVRNFTISPTDLVRIPESVLEENSSINTLKSGDIVITKGGTVGNVALVPDWIPKCAICRDVIGLEVTDDRPEYLVLFLSSKYGKIQFEKMRTQQIQSHLTIAPLKEILVLIPEKFETHIAEMFSQMSDLGEKSLELINEAQEEIYKAVKIDLQNQENKREYVVDYNDVEDVFLPSFYYPTYLTMIKKMREKFQIKKLEDVSTIKRGNEVGSKNYRDFMKKNETDVPFIRTSDLVNFEADDFPDYYIDESIYDNLDQGLQENDLLINNDGKIGLLAILTSEDKCIIQSHIRQVRFDNKVDLYYTFAFLSTDYGQYQFKRYSFTQATIATMSNRLGEVEIPQIDETRKIEIAKKIEKAFYLKLTKKQLMKQAISELQDLLD